MLCRVTEDPRSGHDGVMVLLKADPGCSVEDGQVGEHLLRFLHAMRSELGPRSGERRQQVDPRAA